MSDLELVEFLQNLLFDAFEFLILQHLVIIVFVVDVTGTASSTAAATWSAVPLVSPLV